MMQSKIALVMIALVTLFSFGCGHALGDKNQVEEKPALCEESFPQAENTVSCEEEEDEDPEPRIVETEACLVGENTEVFEYGLSGPTGYERWFVLEKEIPVLPGSSIQVELTDAEETVYVQLEDSTLEEERDQQENIFFRTTSNNEPKESMKIQVPDDTTTVVITSTATLEIEEPYMEVTYWGCMK